MLTDQNGLPTLELRLPSRLEEVDEQMCAPFEEIGEEARRATRMDVPRGPSDAERRTDPGANVASEEEEKKVLTSAVGSRATVQSCKRTTRACVTLETRMPRSRSSRW